MKRGDLVVAHYDEQRGIECIGLVLETRKAEVRKKVTYYVDYGDDTIH